jgi:DNA polymerase-3 subunit delta'
MESNTSFFFIIQKAHVLTAACSNQLLKSIEEPPAGYHFILLADKIDDILPTVRSRCIIKTWHTQSNSTQHQTIIDCFTKKTKVSPSAFASILDASKITEQETKEVIEALLAHWGQQYKKAFIKENMKTADSALQIIEHLKQALIMPPMPGSSKIFWKNLFLQISS